MTTTASNPNPPPDKEARRAFEALVTEHQSRIRRFIQTMGVSGSSADDIAQEALLVAYHRFSDYVEGTSFTAWVCAIARNLIRNDRRKEARRFKILNGKFTEHMESQSIPEEIEDSDEDHHQREALKECMEHISEDNRQLLHARYEEGQEPATMAGVFGMSSGSIRARLMRLRKALHKCISDKVSDWRQQRGAP